MLFLHGHSIRDGVGRQEGWNPSPILQECIYIAEIASSGHGACRKTRSVVLPRIVSRMP